MAFSKRSFSYRGLVLFVLAAFAINLPIQTPLFASTEFDVTAFSVGVSEKVSLPVMKGLMFRSGNPLDIDFIFDTPKGQKLDVSQASKLIRYFLSALTIPVEDIWVNLSPFEGDRIIDADLGKTELGRDLLEQDYLLKQLSSSLTYPDTETGSRYWQQIYQRTGDAGEQAAVGTYSKIWIVPEKVRLYEDRHTVLIDKATLSVMTDKDMVAMEADSRSTPGYTVDRSAEVMKEVILPQIYEDVNGGRNFAPLRQIYNSIALGVWFKKKFYQTLYQSYIDQNKLAGVDKADAGDIDAIYAAYVETIKKGVYDVTRKELDPVTSRKVKRHYFSGGFKSDRLTDVGVMELVESYDDFEGVSAGSAVTLQKGIQPLTADVDVITDYLRQGQFTADITLEAFLSAIKDREAQKALATGGLGFLAGETYGAYGQTGERAVGVMPMYEQNRAGQSINWDNIDGVEPLTYVKEGEKKPFVFGVDFNGRRYDTTVYVSFADGAPVFLFRQPEINFLLYPGEPSAVKQKAFIARAFVEFFKALNVAPDIIRLNEPQLFFVLPAIDNDINYFIANGHGLYSPFKFSKVVLTTHTPEVAALPYFDNMDWLRSQVGAELVPGWAIDGNGHLVMALRLAEHEKVVVINGVAQEHGEVTKQVIMPHRQEKILAITNGSDPKKWKSPELLALEAAGKEVTGKDLFELGIKKKNDLNKYLEKQYGKSFEKVEERPLVGLIRRLVEYKEQGILFALMEFITGDPDVEYDTPWGRRKGLGANLLVGGEGRDSIGQQWVQRFKDIERQERYKGRFIFVEDTGDDVMKAATQAADTWVSMPRNTREACGTSDQRSGFNGHPNVATKTGGPAEYIRHGISGWLLDPFRDYPEYTFEKIVSDMQLPDNYEAKRRIVDIYRKESTKQLAEYLAEMSRLYNEYRNEGKTEWLDMMLATYHDTNNKMSIIRMVGQYSHLYTMVRWFNVQRMAQKFKDIRLDKTSSSLKREIDGGITMKSLDAAVPVAGEGTGIAFGPLTGAVPDVNGVSFSINRLNAFTSFKGFVAGIR